MSVAEEDSCNCDRGFIFYSDGTVGICKEHKQTAQVAQVPTSHNLSPLFTWRSAVVESDLDPQSRLVALVLSLHMNERGGSAFPSYDTLAKESGLHRATVIRRIELLTDSGWLKKSRRKTGRGAVNEYVAQSP